MPIKRDWVSKAEELIKTDKNKTKESRKVRKKRLWLERKNCNRKFIKKDQENIKDWEHLPDLCLELIFQYLSFEVSHGKGHFFSNDDDGLKKKIKQKALIQLRGIFGMFSAIQHQTSQSDFQA